MSRITSYYNDGWLEVAPHGETDEAFQRGTFLLFEALSHKQTRLIWLFDFNHKLTFP